jgi:signal transduction histidine kinase
MQKEIAVRKQAEVALIAAKEEAERANLAKSRFLSSMSHELRTPMNAVLGFAQLMQMDTALQDEHKESVGVIREAGGHLLELIDQVLNLAHIESGNIELVMGPVALAEVVNECLVLTLPLANERGIQIESADFSGITLHTDRLRLKQVLLNLLSNAIKYNRPDGQVKIYCASNDGCLARIMVKDTGQGIPQERMDELFQPFSRLGAENGSIEGSGIGLTISRQLVELMGGAINVQSTPGTGSTFWIELPQERS